MIHGCLHRSESSDLSCRLDSTVTRQHYSAFSSWPSCDELTGGVPCRGKCQIDDIFLSGPLSFDDRGGRGSYRFILIVHGLEDCIEGSQSCIEIP